LPVKPEAPGPDPKSIAPSFEDTVKQRTADDLKIKLEDVVSVEVISETDATFPDPILRNKGADAKNLVKRIVKIVVRENGRLVEKIDSYGFDKVTGEIGIVKPSSGKK
jgi:hypothetical protein